MPGCRLDPELMGLALLVHGTRDDEAYLTATDKSSLARAHSAGQGVHAAVRTLCDKAAAGCAMSPLAVFLASRRNVGY